MENSTTGTWPNQKSNLPKGMVSIPLTDDEIQVVMALRRLKPYGAMKIAKNQNGMKLTITMEESFVVEVKIGI